MSYAMISMLWKHNREKLKKSVYGTIEFYENLSRVKTYDKILKDLDREIGSNSANNHAF